MSTVPHLTNFATNKLLDAMYRAQSLGAPATLYFSLHKGRGKWVASTVYASGDYVVPNTSNGRIYKVTAVSGTGTSGASEPTWPTTSAGTVVDNAGANQITWTEQTTAMLAGTLPTEVSGGSYARVAVTASLANFAGTQSSGSTTASSGTSGVTSNNAAITWPTPTADWTASGAALVIGIWDASTSGNCWDAAVMTNPQTILNGNAAPSAAAAAVSLGLAV